MTLEDNYGSTPGSPGQFATGTFTADATAVETITFASLSHPEVSAFQLRAVPEASTGIMLAAAGTLLVILRRRNQA